MVVVVAVVMKSGVCLCELRDARGRGGGGGFGGGADASRGRQRWAWPVRRLAGGRGRGGVCWSPLDSAPLSTQTEAAGQCWGPLGVATATERE